MKYLTLAVLGLLFAVPAMAQDSTNTSSNTSSSSSSTTSQSGAMNQGVQATVNQLSSGQVEYSGSFTQDVRSQVPLSVVGYGSFSQNNCQNSVGVGATSRVFSFVYNGPKGNPHCEAITRSDQFGRESQLAYAQGRGRDAELLRSMSVWETCNTNETTRQACLKMGLVDGATSVDGRGRESTMVLPKPNHIESRPIAQVSEPTAAQQVVQPMAAQVVGSNGAAAMVHARN